MANLFTKTPNWLRKALGTTQPPLPNQLQTDELRPMLDVGQGGWGAGRWEHLEAGFGAAAGVIIDPFGSNPWYAELNDVTRLVWASVLLAGTGVGPFVLHFELLTQLVNETSLARLDDVAQNEEIPHTRIFRTLDPLVVPPGWRFRVRVPALGAGSTANLRMVVLTVPTGYKPI